MSKRYHEISDERDELRRRVSALEGQLAEAKADLASFETENGTLQGRLIQATKAGTRYSQERDSINALTVDNQGLRSKNAAMEEVIEGLLFQFAHAVSDKRKAMLATGGLSALEDGFRELGWIDPHPVPECECDEPGCHKHISCGFPTDDGYRQTCSDHREAQSEGENENT